MEEYYRVYPYICAALKLYIQDIGEDIPLNKDVFVSFVDVAARAKYAQYFLISLVPCSLWFSDAGLIFSSNIDPYRFSIISLTCVYADIMK